MTDYNGGQEKGGVDWDYYDSPEIRALEERYLPDRGEGETMATQAMTAVTKLVYKWYNDGDVYDNVHSNMEGWANDLSDYANWLYAYIDGAAEILDRILLANITQADYEHILKDINDHICTPDTLKELDKHPKAGTIYACEGPYEYTDDPYGDYDEEE